MTDTTTATPAPPRKRPPPRPAEVLRVDTIAPRLKVVTFGGAGLAGFGLALPSAHIKIIFAGHDAWSPLSEAPRPPSRTYTPRRFDPATNRLEVEFVLHGDGLASNWVERAEAGMTVWIGGPGRGLVVPPELSTIVLAADETAMPAAGMILEALPAGCRAIVACEVADALDERPLSPVRDVTTAWLHRNRTGAAPGSLLLDNLRTVEAPADALWWFAAEAAAIRRARQHLISERGIDRRLVVTRGYWKAGESNHPDHDYGED